MRVYIAGRVKGLPSDQVKAKFERAEQMLRDKKLHPVNPIKHVNRLANNKIAMKVCTALLLECDAIFLLEDWTCSEGAQIEAQLARYAGMHMINEDDLT